MHGKNPFHSYAVGNLAHGKTGIGGAFFHAYDNALENLDSLFFAFPYPDVNLYRVTRAKPGDIHPELFFFNLFYGIHNLFPLKESVFR
jgi:hypothetical protein